MGRSIKLELAILEDVLAKMTDKKNSISHDWWSFIITIWRDYFEWDAITFLYFI